MKEGIMPDRLNKLGQLLESKGCRLEALVSDAEGYAHVLVSREGAMHPFVTWMWNMADNAFYHGDYLSTREEGLKSLMRRARLLAPTA
jgi:hypothetical protein